MAIRDRDHAETDKRPFWRRKQSASDTKPETKRKPTPQRDAPRKSPKSQNGLIRYFQATGDELRKVSWPTREQAIRLTLIVLGSTAVAALFFGLLDFLFQRLAAFLVL